MGQDLINIYSFLYPEELEWLPCSANYRADFCLSDKSCVLNSNGLILHGSRAAFHEQWQFGGSFLQIIYQTFQNHNCEFDTLQDLRNNLEKKFETVDSKDLCYNLRNYILECI